MVRRRVKSSTLPVDARDADHVALAELVLDQDQRAVEVVLDQALGPEPDGDADDAEPGDRGTDVEPDALEHHQDRR